MDSTSVSNLPPQPELSTIDTYADLYKLLTATSEFLGFKTTNALLHSIDLEKDDLCQTVFTFQNLKGQKTPLIASHERSLVCVCEESDFVKVAPLASAFFQIITLPISSSNLISKLETLHQFQQATRDSITEKKRIEQISEEVKYVLSISRELNGERNVIKLLSLILQKAREVTGADAGSIYTRMDKNEANVDGKSFLKFRLAQNDSIAQNLKEFEVPINANSIVGNAVLQSMAINIADLYKLDEDYARYPFALSHDKSWDQKTGYESHSMLTLPIFDISHAIIGVMQLINCKMDPKRRLLTAEDFAKNTIPFSQRAVEYAQIVAYQAGIALENSLMQESIQNLFDGFVNASVRAIEMRDPTTSGHSHRVARLTLDLADVVSRETNGIYKHIRFSDDQMREIRYASLLHDFGKVGVREQVLLKAKKLYPEEFKLVEERFLLIKAMIENSSLQEALDFERSPEKFPPGTSVKGFEIERANHLLELERYYDFIVKANEPTILEQGGFEFLKDISNFRFIDPKGQRRPYLYPNELKALSVSRGSLTAEEFNEIQSHVVHTYEFLRQIPWGKQLANVPQIAAKHHEKIDGTGYPSGAADQDIPIQSRMMTIADIYDALTAADRPYKKAMPVTAALDVLASQVKGGTIDAELFRMFVDAKVYIDT